MDLGSLVGIEDLVAARHQEGEEVYADRQLVIARTRVPTGLRFTGEIDASNADAVSTSLRSAEARDGEVHLDPKALTFIASAASGPSSPPARTPRRTGVFCCTACPSSWSG